MARRLEYPEDWQLECGEIKQRGVHLFKSQLWTDCSFLVGRLPNRAVVNAHKVIVAMASPVFQAMFYGPMAEVNMPIEISDIHPDAFRKMLQYIYTDNIELKSVQSACHLYCAAHKYMLTHLQTVCITYIACNITPELAGSTYQFALTMEEETLVEKCQQMIEEQTMRVLFSKEFVELPFEIIEKIYSMERLSIPSELELVKAAERYLLHQKSKGPRHEEINNNNMDAENIIEDDDTGLLYLQFMFKNASEEVEINELENSNNSSSKCVGNGDKRDVPSLDHNNCQTPSSKDKVFNNIMHGKMRKILYNIRFLTMTLVEYAECPALRSLLTDSELLALVMNAISEKTYMPMPEGFSAAKF